MEKLYVVCWGSGSSDDHGSAHAFTGVHGIYRDKESAKKALTECKDITVGEIYSDIDPDGEYPDLLDTVEVEVYGSEAEEYFEIDYTIGTDPVEVYIGIMESHISD